MLALLLVLAAAPQEPPPPPEGAPPAEAPPEPLPYDDAPAPVVPLEPAAPAVEAPPLEPPPPDAPPKRAPPAKTDGLSGFGLGAAQAGIGTLACCGASLVACPAAFGLGLIPIVGSYVGSVVSAVIVGGTVGFAETWVGDAMGNERAPMLWPIVASTASLLVGSAASIGIGFATGTAAVIAPPDPTDPAAAQAYLAQVGAVAGLQLGVSCLSLTAAIVAPAIVYGITATPKQPGDTGQGLPGFTTPAAPAAGTLTVEAAGPRTVAMRY